MAKKYTSIWKLLQEGNLASEIKVTSTNIFIFKSFFWVAFCLIKHSLVYTHNFENLVQLVSECSCKEIRMHLLPSPKNATYHQHIGQSRYQYYDWIYWSSVMEIANKRTVLYILQWWNTGHIYNWTTSHLSNFLNIIARFQNITLV